jgi:hypothetical protein
MLEVRPPGDLQGGRSVRAHEQIEIEFCGSAQQPLHRVSALTVDVIVQRDTLCTSCFRKNVTTLSQNRANSSRSAVSSNDISIPFHRPFLNQRGGCFDN